MLWNNLSYEAKTAQLLSDFKHTAGVFIVSNDMTINFVSAVNKFWSRRPHWESRRQPTRHEFLRGLGACPPPRKFWNLDAWKCYLQHSPDSIWALRTIKIKTINITTMFYVYYYRSFPQILNHWLLEKSEMINLQMLIKKIHSKF